jgi:hypothetical protein
MATHEDPRAVSAERRLKKLGIQLPVPPEPFGTYVEAVQTGNLLFLSGMLPTEGHGAKFIGRVGAELDVEGGGRRPASRRSTFSRLRGNFWDHSTKCPRLFASACPWPLRETFASSPKWRTALPSCFRMSSDATRPRRAWCLEFRASRSAARWSLRLFSRSQDKRAPLVNATSLSP